MPGKLKGKAIVPNSIPSIKLDAPIAEVVDAGVVPKIISFAYANNANAASPLDGGVHVITGSGFESNAKIYVGNTLASTVIHTNSNSVGFVISSNTPTGIYNLFLVNPDGGVAVYPIFEVSDGPIWSTNALLPSFVKTFSFSYQLSATSDTTITYTLHPGSSLPNGVTLSANGLLSGTIDPTPASTTTYTFTVVATDEENQRSERQFSLIAADSISIVATGGTITDSGPYRIHTFNSSGPFEITTGAGIVEYLVVAGGGGGGVGQSAPRGGQAGGGGGAGGYRIGNGYYIAGNTYSVVVGAGGSGAANGSISSFDSIVSAGGGGGGSGDTAAGLSGGSGGGGSSGGPVLFGPGSGGAGGSGNVPAASPSQGNNGARGIYVQSTGHVGGGGGGAGGAAVDNNFAGGAGANSDISGTTVTRARGGDGGRGSNIAGETNTGNGGGGGLYSGGQVPGSAGGSGVVILRYQK